MAFIYCNLGHQNQYSLGESKPEKCIKCGISLLPSIAKLSTSSTNKVINIPEKPRGNVFLPIVDFDDCIQYSESSDDFKLLDIIKEELKKNK